MRKFSLLIVILCSWIGFTFAHQPRLVFDRPEGQVIDVQNPEVSQAFYGILSGQEDIYQIVSNTGFLLYISLVVPKMSGNRTDFTVDLMEWNMAVYTRLDGTRFDWTDFFEPFAGDMYLQWPSIEKTVGSGTYIIRVSNVHNQGKYSLAIGKIESFPINETIHTYKVLPELKMTFFEKPWYTVVRNVVWWGMVGILLIVVGIVWLMIILVRRIKK